MLLTYLLLKVSKGVKEREEGEDSLSPVWETK